MSSCEMPLPVCLPQSLHQQPNMHDASGVLGTICHYAPAPISHQLETILLASSLDAQTAKGNFVIKAGCPQPNSTCHQGKKQGATMSRQQANGTSLTSGSSTTPQIQTKRCHLARHHYRLPATVSAPTTCWQPCCQRCAWHTDILCSPNQQST